jgi:uncharacterized membrane protein
VDADSEGPSGLGGPFDDSDEETRAARHWRGGIFYVNRNDPSVSVRWRFGVGYTLNVGQPTAWVLLSVRLAAALAPLLVAAG